MASGNTEQITEGFEGNCRFPNFSPDGNSILFNIEKGIVQDGDEHPTATVQFMVFNFNSGNFQKVEMFHEFAYPNPIPTWSPDGNKILYEQYEKVFTYDLNTEELEVIYQEDGFWASDPSYTPDGSTIAYKLNSSI
jgi:Tol biopolymer transport system component